MSAVRRRLVFVQFLHVTWEILWLPAGNLKYFKNFKSIFRFLISVQLLICEHINSLGGGLGCATKRRSARLASVQRRPQPNIKEHGRQTMTLCSLWKHKQFSWTRSSCDSAEDAFKPHPLYKSSCCGSFCACQQFASAKCMRSRLESWLRASLPQIISGSGMLAVRTPHVLQQALPSSTINHGPCMLNATCDGETISFMTSAATGGDVVCPNFPLVGPWAPT